MSTRLADKAISHERRRAGETALSDFAEYVEKQQQTRRTGGGGAPPGASAGTAASAADHDELDILESLGLADEAAEIKLKELFLNQSDETRNKLRDLITARIAEGRGETIFDIGIENNLESMKFGKEEYQTALKRVEEVAKELDAGVTVLLTKNAGEETDVPAATTSDVSAKVLIRRQPKSMEELLEIRVAVVGNGT